MTPKAKNRVTLCIDEEGGKKLVVYLATVEQVRVFTTYIQRSLNASFISYTHDIYTECGWANHDERTITPYKNSQSKRETSAPFHLRLRVCADEHQEEFDLDFYLFSSTDINFLNTILKYGTRRKNVVFEYFNRDIETREWVPYTCSAFVPVNVSTLYSSLNQENQALAIEQMQQLAQSN